MTGAEDVLEGVTKDVLEEVAEEVVGDVGADDDVGAVVGDGLGTQNFW